MDTQLQDTRRWSLGIVACLILFALPLLADDVPPAKKTATPPVVVAKVGSQTITQRDVDYEVRRALAGQDLPAHVRRHLEAQALQQLVDRQIVLASLERESQAAGNQEVEQAMLRLKDKLARQKLTLAQYVEQLGIDEASLRGQFAWQLTWRKYLEKYFTDENLQKYFEKHHRDFDGTQLQVAHILFKVNVDVDAEKRQASRLAAIEQARKLRAEITSGKLSFVEAAAKHSAAPTAKQGGDIGLISRRDPMPESFSRIAYALEKGAISEPAETEFGVHLITVVDIKPGQKMWKDVREELEPALSQYLFAWLAGKERATVEVEFTGKSPYFDPKTGEVILPSDKSP